MNKYKNNTLRESIENSKLIVRNSHFKVRLSQELLKKYDNNLYSQDIINRRKTRRKIENRTRAFNYKGFKSFLYEKYD